MESADETTPAPDGEPSEAADETTREPNAEPTEPIEITSVAEFLEALRSHFDRDAPRWFRGHVDTDWVLLPSIARPPHDVEKEMTLMKRFRQNAYAFLPRPPGGEWEWLFLMQHYGVPTRLLDWTESPLMGLFFAVEKSECSVDACVWALDPIGLNKVARLEPAHQHDLPLFGEDTELDNYLPSRIHGSPSMNSATPAAAIAPRQFNRLQAQLGVFTITHREQRNLMDPEFAGG